MTASKDTPDLKEALYKEFKQPIKRRSKNSHIVIDDRSERDRGSDGQLYSWFCQIFAEVVDPKTVSVSLRGNVPIGPAVKDWLSLHKVAEPEGEGNLVFGVTSTDVKKLKTLSQAVRSIVQRGAKYSVPSYKYVCPRVARTLDRLYTVLRTYWTQVKKISDAR